MYRIAIVEDDVITSYQIKSLVQRYGLERERLISINVFNDGDQIIENYRSQYDIIFMDIQMKSMQGLEAAQIIRKMDTNVIIVFITNFPQHAIDGYKVKAFDYIIKPLSFFMLSQRFDRFIDRVDKRKNRFILVSDENGIHKINTNDLKFVESHGHQLTYYLARDIIYTNKMTMQRTEDMLKECGFFRCSKGCIINLDYVETVADSCVLIDEKWIVVSRSRRKELKEALLQL